MPDIHPSAIVHSSAQLADNVSVGPFSIIGPDVQLGNDCKVDAYVQIKGNVTAGRGNSFYHGACIGEAPQDISFDNPTARIEIGDNNVIRENVTIHLPSKPGNTTKVGNNNYLMVGSHLGHDVQMGNNIFLVNCAAIAGYVEISDNAYISGLVGVHQFVKIGRFALISGVSMVTKDVPPFTVSAGSPAKVHGLNLVGLKRAKMSTSVIRVIKNLYKTLYFTGEPPKKIVEKMQTKLLAQYTLNSEEYNVVKEMIDFINTSNRGILSRDS